MSELVIGAPVPPPRASEINCAASAEVLNALTRAVNLSEELLALGEQIDTRALLNRVLLNQQLLQVALISLIGGVTGAFRPQAPHVQPATVIPHLRRV